MKSDSFSVKWENSRSELIYFVEDSQMKHIIVCGDWHGI